VIAKNHEKIFVTVYADLIAALDRAGRSGGAHPYALYLGNWMADFSQLYSPDLPNILIDLLDLPDTMRTLAADAQQFLDAQQKALPAAIAAAVTKASLDKPALARMAAKVKASPYQNDKLLKSYADYLRAAPSPLVTPLPETKPLTIPSAPAGDVKQVSKKPSEEKRESAHSTLRNIASRIARAQAAQAPDNPQPDAAALVATLIKFTLAPLFDDLRNILKSVNQAANVADEAYQQLLKFLEAVGFVDKFNDTAQLAIWLVGLFKFSNPANASSTEAPITGTGAAPSGTLAAVPSFKITPQSPGPPSTATLRVDEHIPPNIYSKLFAKYFGFYKPYEHLDRFMDAGRVAEATGGGTKPRTLDQKREFRHYRKDNYPLIVTPIASLKGKIQGLDLDATLWSGLQIAYGRLLDLRQEKGQALPINERLLLLGRSFHVFEDYFAHTNFVDRLIYSMQLEHGFRTHPFELKKILLSVASEDAFNALKADKGLFGNLDCADKTVRKIIEAGATECVKSGFYDTPDTIHSLVHLLEGVVKQALDMEDEQRDSRFDLYDVLEKYALRQLEAIDKARESWEKADLLTLLTTKRDDIFLDAESFEKLARNNALIKSMGNNGDFMRKLVNWIFWLILAYYTAKHARNGYVAVRSAVSFFITVMKVVKLLYFTPNVIVRYLRIAFSVVPEPIRDELIALAIEAFKEVGRVLASIVFAWLDKILENSVRYGSHSLMAKDEATHQGRLYALAEQFGILIDKAALEFVFPKPAAKPADPLAPSPQDVLERLLDGIAYNPLKLERDALTCVSHGLLTRYTLDQPEQSLDTYLKGCVKAYLDEEGTFEGIPGFFALLLFDAKPRYAEAMRTMVRLNADKITLIAGNDPLYLSDAVFKLLKPASEVELIVWKRGQTSALKSAPAEIMAKPWTVSFVDAFMSGKPSDWKTYDLTSLTAGKPSGKRSLPEDYRTLAEQFIGDYGRIWQNILIIPGTLSFGQAL
jgi:hypothetical protein